MKKKIVPINAGRKLLISEELNKNNFDFLRFLFATAVIYSHCYVIFHGAIKNIEPICILTHNQIDLGGVAVCFFFVISGFLIVKSFENSHTNIDYLIKRVLRICPGFFVAFLVSVFVLGALGTINPLHKFGQWKFYFEHLAFKRLSLNFLTFEAPKGVKTFSTNRLPDMINEPFWTIQYEFTCYLLVPLLGIISIIKRRWLAIVFFLVSFILLVLQTVNIITITDNEKNWVFLYPSELPLLLASFFSGSCYYFFRAYIPRSIFLVLLSAVLILFSSWFLNALNLLLPLAGSYVLFYLAYHSRFQFHNFAKRGDYSYGLYLYGWPVQQLIVYFFSKQIGPNQLFFIAFPIILLFAYLSWHIVENRFLKMKKLIIKSVSVKQVIVTEA
ncbi:MAG TPA: acyltransferase [Mucilaginibacter sp.]|jgi:peptidoglycan/LPS O-acetylase OafA/YrhL